MARVLALFLAFALLFQASWSVAATYCEHETSSRTAVHFGHHAHVHENADGKKAPGSKLAVDEDCAFCHAGHPAIVPTVVACAAPGTAATAGGSPRPMSASAPSGAPERPQWTRLA